MLGAMFSICLKWELLLAQKEKKDERGVLLLSSEIRYLSLF